MNVLETGDRINNEEIVAINRTDSGVEKERKMN
jgi:hypothetical protein